jgi:anti-anti-sigma regulatory factor
MTLRITIRQEEAIRIVQVAGRLDREGAGELVQEVGYDPGGTCLDLEDLRSVDAAGLSALRRMRAAGVRMRGVPKHLAWQLEAGEP